VSGHWEVPVQNATLDILFVMRHAGFVRNYQSTIVRLLNGGHRVHVAYQLYRRKHNETVLAKRLAATHERFTYGVAPPRERDEWGGMAMHLRLYLDYLRYLESHYRRAGRLRQRVAAGVPAVLRWVGLAAARLGDSGVSVLSAAIRALERCVPFSPGIRAFMESRPCSMLLLTPLVDVGSDQVDYIREASRRGIPTALCVASWDNLTNKGLMRVVPDRVFLWNEGQKREAVELHGARAEQVVVTGAQLFDEWFKWEPSRTREAFAAHIGLRGDRPFVLYLGSSFFIAPKEAKFAEDWVTALRASSDPLVADAEILVRPHPKNRVQWLGSKLTQDPRVTIWPPVDADPFGPEFKNDFFDSMWYSGVVVAVNTSAEVEAAIIGRTICTVRAPEFEHSQAGTLHFGHLDGEDGVVIAARDMDEHVEHIRQALVNPAQFLNRTKRFVERFVRPHGIDVPATPILTSAIEGLAKVIPTAERAAERPGLLARVLRPVAVLVSPYRLVQKDPVWMPVARPLYQGLIRLIVGAAGRNLLPRVGPWATRTTRPRANRTKRLLAIQSFGRAVHKVRKWATLQWRFADRVYQRMSNSASRLVKRGYRRGRSSWFAARRVGARVRRLVRG
jgi:hypothetical protein